MPGQESATMLHHPRRWFRPKRLGFGYSPATWEGWFATALLVLAIFGVRSLLR
ncbi:MAG: hypothetical protein ACTHOJ_04255 [Sphingomonas oligoaromativorans]|jgi:hypothetical protein